MERKIIYLLVATIGLLCVCGERKVDILHISVQPQIITTQTDFNVTIDHPKTNYTIYKFSFGAWQFMTMRKRISYRYSLAGNYIVMASALFNSTWLPWARKKITVFDHDKVVQSVCSISIIATPELEDYQNNNRSLAIKVSLTDCFGIGELSVFEIDELKEERNKRLQQKLFSFGNSSKTFKIYIENNCTGIEAYVALNTPKETLTKQVNHTSFLSNSRCENETTFNGQDSKIPVLSRSNNSSINGTQTGSNVVTYGTLNPIVAIFFCCIMIVYLTNGVIAYRGYKYLLKPVLNLTNIEDDFMYEILLHVGSGLSTSTSKCEILFTVFGANDVMGPISLPASSFENDGIAPFLISTSKNIGEIATIGIFCKNMDLRSDLYLRKVEILRHSQKPSGNHWGDDDVIEKVMVVECHSWFSPAIKSNSVAQIFNSSTDRCEKSLGFDYLVRFNQLFLQKHILTTWRCSFGVSSFTKAQRLSFFFTLWFLLITCATFYVVTKGIEELPNSEHMYQIGIIRLDERTVGFAISNAVLVYLIGVVLCLIVNVVYGSGEENRTKRPIQVDSKRSNVFTGIDTGNGPSRVKSYNNSKSVSRNDNKTEDRANGISSYSNGGLVYDADDDRVGTSAIGRNNGINGIKYIDGTNDIANDIASTDDKSGTNPTGGTNGANCKSGTNSTVGTNSPGLDVDIGATLEENMTTYMNSNENSALPNNDEINYSGRNGQLQDNSRQDKPLQVKSVVVDVKDEINENCVIKDGRMMVEVKDALNKQHHNSQQNGSQKDTNSVQQIALALDVEEEKISNGISANEDEIEENNKEAIHVQYLNRETIPTGKENRLKTCSFNFSGRLFWIAHFILLIFCTLYSIIVSTDWDPDIAYHWVSMHFLSLVVSCLFMDTIRVLGYVLSITLKERRQLHNLRKKTSFEEYTKTLLASKQAEFERRAFCKREYPEDRMRFVQDYYRLRGKFREFFLFGLFVAMLLVMTTWTMNEDSFRFWRALRYFVFNSDKLTTIQSKGETVDPTANFWSWLNMTLPPLLDINKRDISLQQLHLLRNYVVLSQKRIIKGRCQVLPEMEKIISECNVPYKRENEDMRSYLPGWRPSGSGTIRGDAWQWTSLNRDGGYTQGYIAKFNATNAKETVKELVQNSWIDKYTREVSIEMFIYNPSANLLASVLIKIEFSISNHIKITERFFNYILFPESAKGHEVAQVAETIFFIITCYFVFDIVRRKHRTSMSWLSGWLILQIAVIILSFVVIVMNAYRNYNVYLVTLKSTRRMAKVDILKSIDSSVEAYEFILANLNLLSFILLLKPLLTLGLFDDMYIALYRTVSDLKGIAIETVTIIFGFACWANLAFAANISSFASMDTTLATLMDMLVRPDHDALYDIRVYGPLLLLVYFCIMILFVSNLVISSVEASYSEARRVFDHMKRETVIRVIMKKFERKNRGEKRMLKYDLTLRSTIAKKVTKAADEAKENSQSEGSSDQKSDKPSMAFRQHGDRRIAVTSDVTLMNNNAEGLNSSKQKKRFIPDSLVEAVNRLERVASRKILFEHVEDKLLISTIISKWDNVVLKKPKFDVICMYKPRLRQPSADIDKRIDMRKDTANRRTKLFERSTKGLVANE